MRPLKSLIFLLASGSISMSAAQTLWYDRPAADWMMEALPVGNGRIGAMVFGGVEQERVQFNDKTLWTGSPTVRGAYQNFGDVLVDFGESGAVSDYRRELDLADAIARVSYRAGVRYSREYLASHPDELIAMRFTASRPGTLSFSVALNGAHGELVSVATETERGTPPVLLTPAHPTPPPWGWAAGFCET